jgi:hypothetical protein
MGNRWPSASRINALGGYLNDYQPDELAQIRETFPAHADVLRPGTTLGTLDSDTVVYAEATRGAVRLALRRAEPSRRRLRSRLVRARNSRLAGNAMATITGVRLITVFVANERAVAIAAARLVARPPGRAPAPRLPWTVFRS